ncbi:hypothetical protein [Naasia sp. SYSU D00948]|uniref:type IV pilus modification PilV family protein n=1 Tax=Naasia sp. SYSU D00948 TaxID=2817379 RepID=UPI001B317433|nr:hypothetical protein [Naasia sp. SYSU D00948]
MSETIRSEVAEGDAGIGLIEIVIAMFVLALLALSFAPLIAGSPPLAAGSADRATAAELVERQLAEARGQTATCSGITAYAAAPALAASTGRGIALTSSRTVTCPPAYPGTARLTVSVSGGGSVLASATTLIFVSAA